MHGWNLLATTAPKWYKGFSIFRKEKYYLLLVL
jgi:hypothetical protein